MRTIGTVAIVIFGLAVMMGAVGVLATSVWMLPTMSMDGTYDVVPILLFVAGVALLLGAGFWLVAKRQFLAERLFEDTEASLLLDGSSLLRVGLILIGVVWVFGAIPRFISAASAWFTYLSIRTGSGLGSDYAFGTWTDTVLPNVLAGAVELGFGVLFVMRSEPLADRLWGLGSIKSESHDEAESPSSTLQP